MKTSVNMVRNMGDYDIIQRTEDGYFEANHLLRQWNITNKEKYISNFLNNIKTKQFIEEICEQETHTQKNEDGDFKAVITVKGRNTKNGKTPDCVFMHPFLFIDFAMWLNPKFKYQVIKFVYDQLIEFRHAAGDKYNILRFNVAKRWHPEPEFYKKLNRGLNFVVFGTHKRGIRNSATEEQLTDLVDLQKVFNYNINSGLIKNRKQLITELRKEYVRRYVPDHKTLQDATN